MEKKKNDKERIMALGLGETDVWPIEKLTSIRSLASQCCLVTGNKYVTSSDRYERTITVKRVE